jgi:hypothetical protein
MITLAASYYNKTVELEYLLNIYIGNKEYLGMSLDSIANAMLVTKYIPENLKLNLVDEIKKMYAKLQFKTNGVIRMSSRDSSRRSQGRMFSPPSSKGLKETSSNNAFEIGDVFKRSNNSSEMHNFLDMSPKSLESGKASLYYTNFEQNSNPVYRRKLNESDKRGNKTEMMISYSPVRSEGADSEKVELR